MVLWTLRGLSCRPSPKILPCRLLALERAADRVGIAHPAEERLHAVDDGVLDERRARLLGGIANEDAEAFPVVRVAQRRFDAYVGRDAGEDEVTDASRAQQGVEGGPGEAAVARLRHDEIALLRLEARYERVVPRPVRKNLAPQLRPRSHQLQRGGLLPVGRRRPAGALEIRIPAVLQIHHRQAGAPRGAEQALRIV